MQLWNDFVMLRRQAPASRGQRWESSARLWLWVPCCLVLLQLLRGLLQQRQKARGQIDMHGTPHGCSKLQVDCDPLWLLHPSTQAPSLAVHLRSGVLGDLPLLEFQLRAGDSLLPRGLHLCQGSQTRQSPVDQHTTFCEQIPCHESRYAKNDRAALAMHVVENAVCHPNHIPRTSDPCMGLLKETRSAWQGCMPGISCIARSNLTILLQMTRFRLPLGYWSAAPACTGNVFMYSWQRRWGGGLSDASASTRAAQQIKQGVS